MMAATWVLQGFGSGTGGGVLPDQEVYSPAAVVAQFLIDMEVVSIPLGLPSDDWPVYISAQPTKPTNVVTTYDTAGIISAQRLSAGKTVKHQGVSVRIRGINYRVGYAKAEAIYKALEEVSRYEVNFSNAIIRLDNVSLQGPVLSIGQEPETRRDIFVINCRTSLTPVTLP